MVKKLLSIFRKKPVKIKLDDPYKKEDELLALIKKAINFLECMHYFKGQIK